MVMAGSLAVSVVRGGCLGMSGTYGGGVDLGVTTCGDRRCDLRLRSGRARGHFPAALGRYSRPSSRARRTAAERLLTSSLVKMRLVWVRSVFRDTNNWRASSGPVRSLSSRRRTSSSRSLSGSARGTPPSASAGAALRAGGGVEESSGVLSQHVGPAAPLARSGVVQQGEHRGPLVEEQAHVALRFRRAGRVPAPTRRAPPVGHPGHAGSRRAACRSPAGCRLVSGRRRRAAVPAGASTSFSGPALSVPTRSRVAKVPGQQQPHEGEVLVLPQEGHVVAGRDAAVAAPTPRPRRGLPPRSARGLAWQRWDAAPGRSPAGTAPGPGRAASQRRRGPRKRRGPARRPRTTGTGSR